MEQVRVYQEIKISDFHLVVEKAKEILQNRDNALIKTIKKEKDRLIVEQILEQYQKQAGVAFYQEAIRLTGRSRKTIKRHLQTIRSKKK
jgi:hypothetical protein